MPNPVEVWTRKLGFARMLREYGIPVRYEGQRRWWYPQRVGLFFEVTIGADERGRLHHAPLSPAMQAALRRALVDDAFWNAVQTVRRLGGCAAAYAFAEARAST